VNDKAVLNNQAKQKGQGSEPDPSFDPEAALGDLMRRIDKELFPKPRPLGLGLLLLFILSLIVVGGVGHLRMRGVLVRCMPWGSRSCHAEYQQNVTLIQEQTGRQRRLTVEVDDRASRLVSGDDTTATGPAISRDGTWVAYVSKRDGDQVVIVSLTSNSRRAITAEQILLAGQNAGMSGLHLCCCIPLRWGSRANDLILYAREKGKLGRVPILVDVSGAEIRLVLGEEASRESKALGVMK